jgi:hypothetical protein
MGVYVKSAINEPIKKFLGVGIYQNKEYEFENYKKAYSKEKI